jgi:hypothetical protein
MSAKVIRSTSPAHPGEGRGPALLSFLRALRALDPGLRRDERKWLIASGGERRLLLNPENTRAFSHANEA